MEEAGRKSVARLTRKESKGALQAETATGQQVQKITVTSQAETPALKPVSDEPSLLPASDRASHTTEL